MVSEEESERQVAAVLGSQPVQSPGQSITAPVAVPAEDMIAALNKAVERAEEANRVTAALIERQERLHVQRTIGGSAVAGSPVLSSEQKARRDAKEFLAGTGYEEELFPDV